MSDLVIAYIPGPEPRMEVTVGDQTASLTIPDAADRFEEALRLTEQNECAAPGCTSVIVQGDHCTYHLTGDLT
jgi:hypothetical protein